MIVTGIFKRRGNRDRLAGGEGSRMDLRILPVSVGVVPATVMNTGTTIAVENAPAPGSE